MSATRRNPIRSPLARHQRGVGLITAVFLITGLAVLGAMMTRMMTLSSSETISEWYSAQALYAAESGVDWAARSIIGNNVCINYTPPVSTANIVVVNGSSWVDVSISCSSVNNLSIYTITSTGKAGGTSATPATQRELQVMFSP